MIRVLILNGYSAANRGDGLLVDETISLIREAVGVDAELTLIASYPESFKHLGIRVISSKPSLRGYAKDYLHILRSKFVEFDAVVGVGGGYLRAGSCVELVKMALVMGPQLVQASRSTRGTVYLPQSIGPARLGSRRLLMSLLSKLDRVWVRDPRSMTEFGDAGVLRAPDLAILGMARRSIPFAHGDRPVLTVRSHRGGVPFGVQNLRTRLGVIDSFVQSTVGGNNDTEAVNSILPRSVLETEELLSEPKQAKVIVAMRLHAALMAIDAGHYVIHLSYERKGFGAFSDLGLSEYVYNVHDFDEAEVAELVEALLNDETRRRAYDDALTGALARLSEQRTAVVASIRDAVGVPAV